MHGPNEIPEVIPDETEEDRIDRVLRELGIALPKIEAASDLPDDDLTQDAFDLQACAEPRVAPRGIYPDLLMQSEAGLGDDAD